jgi:hypothetical protein
MRNTAQMEAGGSYEIVASWVLELIGSNLVRDIGNHEW